MSKLPEDDVADVINKYGIKDEVKQVPKPKKTYKLVPKNVNAVPSAKSVYGGNIPTTRTGIRVDIEPNQVAWNTVPSSPIKNIASKIAKSSAGRIAQRVASSGVVRAAGVAGMVMGSAGDIMNISKAIREVRKAIIYKPVESIPRTTTTNQQYANLQKAKSRSAKSSAVKPLNQAQRNSEAGAKLRANPNWQKTIKSSGVDTKPSKSQSKKSSKPSGVVPTSTSSSSSRFEVVPTSTSSSSSRTARTARTKPMVSTPSLIPKRPDLKLFQLPHQITEDRSFLNAPSFTSSVRKSPVRPIPTRVQMPEQFMSPSMSLASLPKIDRYKLGVSR
jgi:hypothetical protein